MIQEFFDETKNSILVYKSDEFLNIVNNLDIEVDLSDEDITNLNKEKINLDLQSKSEIDIEKGILVGLLSIAGIALIGCLINNSK